MKLRKDIEDSLRQSWPALLPCVLSQRWGDAYKILSVEAAKICQKNSIIIFDASTEIRLSDVLVKAGKEVLPILTLIVHATSES